MWRLALPALVALALALAVGACGRDESPAEGAGTGDPGGVSAPTGETSQDADAPAASGGVGGGGSSASTGSAPAALPGLPPWTAGYRRWEKLNAAPLPPRDSDPHLGTKNVYASRPSRNGAYPPGTIVVKEGFRPGKDFVGLVATMRKLEGRNPAHNDWVFVEWARESPGQPFTELASGGVCESCHSGVADRDYVFTRG